jgi:hypothetical protein
MAPAVRRLAAMVVLLVALTACVSPRTSSGRSATTTAATAPAHRTTDGMPPGPSPIATLAAAVGDDDPVAAAVRFLEVTQRVTSMTPDEAAAAQRGDLGRQRP